MEKRQIGLSRSPHSPRVGYNLAGLDRIEDRHFESERYTICDDNARAWVKVMMNVNSTLDGHKHVIVEHTHQDCGLLNAVITMYRPYKANQLDFINTTIDELGLSLLHTEYSNVEWNVAGEFTPKSSVVIKPPSGACSKGVGLVAGTVYIPKFKHLLIENGKKLGTVLGDDPCGQVLNSVTHGIAVEYRAVRKEFRMFVLHGQPQIGYERPRIELQPDFWVPSLVEHGDEYLDMHGDLIPDSVWQEIVKLTEHLNIWGYSIDVYETIDGEWGIFEYSPEFGTVNFRDADRDHILSNKFGYWINQLEI